MFSSRGQRMLHSSRYKRSEAKFSSMEDARVFRAIQKRQEQKDRRGESYLRFRALNTTVEDDTPPEGIKHATPIPRGFLKHATPTPGSYLKHAITHKNKENKQERTHRRQLTKKELKELGRQRYQNMLVWRDRRRQHLEQQKQGQKHTFHAGQYQPDPPKFLSGQDVDPTTGRVTPLKPAPHSLKKGTPSFLPFGQSSSKGVAKPARFHSGVTLQPTMSRAHVSTQTQHIAGAQVVRAVPCRRPLGTHFRPPPGIGLSSSPATPSVLDYHSKPASITHSFGISEFTFKTHVDGTFPQFGPTKENSNETSQNKKAPSYLNTSFTVASPAVAAERALSPQTPPSPVRLRPRTPCSRSTRRSKLAHCDHTHTPMLPTSKRKGRPRLSTKGPSGEVESTPQPPCKEEEGWLAHTPMLPTSKWKGRPRFSTKGPSGEVESTPQPPCNEEEEEEGWLAHTPMLPTSKRKGRPRLSTKGTSGEVESTPQPPCNEEEEEEGWLARLNACPWITRSRGSSGKRRREAGGPASAPWTDLDDIAMMKTEDASPILRKNEVHSTMADSAGTVLQTPDTLVWSSPASANQEPQDPTLPDTAHEEPLSPFPAPPKIPPPSPAPQEPPSSSPAPLEPALLLRATENSSAVRLWNEAQVQMSFLTRPTQAPIPPTPDTSVWSPSPPSPATPTSDEPPSEIPAFPRKKTRSSVSFAGLDPCSQEDFSRTKFPVTPVHRPSRKLGVSPRVSLLPGLYPTRLSCAEDHPTCIDDNADLISWESPDIVFKKIPRNKTVIALTPLRRSARLSRTGRR